MVDVSQLNLLIAKLRKVIGKDLIMPQDHNDQTDCVKKIRDILQSITIPSGNGGISFKSMKEGYLTQIDEVIYTKTIPNGGKRYKCLQVVAMSDKSKLGIIAFTDWGSCETELKSNDPNVYANASLAVLSVEPTIGQEIDNGPYQYFDNSFFDFGVSGSDPVYSPSVNHAYGGGQRSTPIDNKVWLTLWIGISNYSGIEKECIAYLRNLRAGLMMVTSCFDV